MIKTFKDFLRDLQESPQDNSFFSKETMSDIAKHHKDFHIQHHKDRVAIGNDNYKVVKSKDTYYTHLDHNQQPHEVSFFKDNVQKVISKGTGSNVHILHHSNQHLEDHGEVITDSGHSPGAKHHWINWIKSNPKDVKFEVRHHSGKTFPVDHTNIDAHIDDIWGRHSSNMRTTVRAYVDRTKK